MIPYYKITNNNGQSGKHIKRIKFLSWGVYDGSLNVCRFGVKGRFNPFRIQAGGTSFGYKGKNYWIPDDTLIGRILKRIFV